MSKTRFAQMFVLAFVLLATTVTPAFAKKNVGVGSLFYEGEVVRTVVPPAAMPQEGRDNFYAIVGGAAGQLGVVAVAPGDKGYHGGQWAFHEVTWNVAAPYLLKSEMDVLDAEKSGDISIERMPGADFKCPIQP